MTMKCCVIFKEVGKDEILNFFLNSISIKQMNPQEVILLYEDINYFKEDLENAYQNCTFPITYDVHSGWPKLRR